MVVSSAEMTMLDYLTARLTVPQKEPSLEESLAVKRDEKMAPSLVEKSVAAMVRLMDLSLVEELDNLKVRMKDYL